MSKFLSFDSNNGSLSNDDKKYNSLGTSRCKNNYLGYSLFPTRPAIDSIILVDLDNTMVFTDTANNFAYFHALEEVSNNLYSMSYKENIYNKSKYLCNLNNFLNTNISRITLKEIEHAFNFPSELIKDIKLSKDKLFSKYINYTKINLALYNLLTKLKDKYSVKLFITTYANKERANYIYKHYKLDYLFDEMFCTSDTLSFSKYLLESNEISSNLNNYTNIPYIYKNKSEKINKYSFLSNLLELCQKSYKKDNVFIFDNDVNELNQALNYGFLVENLCYVKPLSASNHKIKMAFENFKKNRDNNINYQGIN